MTTKPKILIVDDEVLLAMEVEMILTDAGFEAIGPVHSVPAALDLIDTTRPDGAVLDVNLDHRGTSNAVADRLEALGVPFIFLTGYAPEHIPDPQRARQVIGKPFIEADLLKAVSDLVGAQTAEAGAPTGCGDGQAVR